jgi:CRP-like cAMP-binding protein
MPSPLAEFRAAVAANTLRSCQLFASVAPGDLETIASFAISKQLAKGDYLFHKGAPSEGFYVVQRGAINLHRVSATGKEQVIHVFRTGQSFAEAALASEGGYPADARAIEDSAVLLIPKTDFVALMRRNPELAMRMLGSMSQHLRILIGLIDDLTLKDIESRLANWLLKRCPRPFRAAPTTFQLDRTKRVLAAELGTVSETLSRTLGKFRNDHLLRVAGKTITILNPARLDKLLRQNLGEI